MYFLEIFIETENEKIYTFYDSVMFLRVFFNNKHSNESQEFQYLSFLQ